MSPSLLHQAAWPYPDYKLRGCLLTSHSHKAAISVLPHGSSTPFQTAWPNPLMAAPLSLNPDLQPPA